MATIYNKTALKKVKKDELIQMFLDLQAQRINDSMDEAVEKCCNNAIEEVVEGLKKENKRLKKGSEATTEKNSQLWSENKKLKAELDDVKADLEWNKHEVVRYSVALEEEYVLKDEYETLKEQAEDAFQSIAEALCGEGEEADSIAGWGQERQIIGRINLMKKINQK